MEHRRGVAVAAVAIAVALSGGVAYLQLAAACDTLDAPAGAAVERAAPAPGIGP
ncbi:hypothetical protein GCM10010124_10750 [Pilimelia terevasa]|uniref:Uncharacterized protein n=1 Tax=Pilimelia terevasa TaxID=53372 RepID=A0A8J3BLL2_9ACTN|nr:hypothetical protein [Pilimelia terevasa]GGK19998.1 hypothetical protein GCM10010124_10750 [Pilimelia terevasa]